MKPTDLAVRITDYLGVYLPSHRNLSPNTIHSYRDTFTLLLHFMRDEKGCRLERLGFEHLGPETIKEFLTHLETGRGVSIATRNQRLAALRSFFRYVQAEEPEQTVRCQQILAIRSKRQPRPAVCYLESDQLKAILGQPDLYTTRGRRDAVLIALLYDTGARVQEIIDLTLRNVRLEKPAVVRLRGKGRKERTVPLMSGTVRMMMDYFTERGLLDAPVRMDEPLFLNQVGKRLTRAGVRHILNKHAASARSSGTTLPDQLSPHVLRHTKAMHLLQSGAPLVIIRDFLGHMDIRTSEVYARADVEMKRGALEKAAPLGPQTALPAWQKDKGLLDWLRSL